MENPKTAEYRKGLIKLTGGLMGVILLFALIQTARTTPSYSSGKNVEAVELMLGTLGICQNAGCAYSDLIPILLVYLSPIPFGIYILFKLATFVKWNNALWRILQTGLAHIYVLVMAPPIMIGFPVVLVLRRIIHKIFPKTNKLVDEKNDQGQLETARLDQLITGDFSYVGVIYSIIIYAAFQYGVLGELGRLLLFISLVLFIPLCICIAIMRFNEIRSAKG